MDLATTLLVKRIDNGIDQEVTVDIHDVSKSGIGFTCNEELQIDSVYESYIRIWTQEVIHTLLKVVRKTKQEEGYLYGAIFMGLSEVDAFRISVYDTMDQELHKVQEQARQAGESAGSGRA